MLDKRIERKFGGSFSIQIGFDVETWKAFGNFSVTYLSTLCSNFL